MIPILPFCAVRHSPLFLNTLSSSLYAVLSLKAIEKNIKLRKKWWVTPLPPLRWGGGLVTKGVGL